MPFPTVLGSPAALSLAATPNRAMTTALPLATAGIVVTVVAATFIYKNYNDHVAKKNRKKIEKINSLHKQHLEKILIPGNNEIRGFPLIYRLDPDNAKTVDSMHLTEDEVAAIGTSSPHGTDTELADYREAVQSAILKLKDYYFSRSDQKDITSGVLTYLLYMLESKCLNFAGYQYDIAYLDALANFINAYASIKGIETSQHFSRLQPVYKYLLNAKQLLEKHQESLSLEEFVAELRDSCLDNSNRLLRNFVKLIIPPKQSHFVDTAAMDEMKVGQLRRQYIHSEIGGIELKTDHEIHLPESIFRQWIMGLSNYYLKSLSSDVNLSDESLLLPETMIAFVDKARVVLEGGMLKNLKSNLQVKVELSSIRDVFRNSPNFITTKLDSTRKKQKFIAISDNNEVLDRTQILGNFAKLIHQVISLQFLSTHLLKNIKQLGEIYARDPNHFNEIFTKLDILCQLIQENIEKNLSAFKDIEKANDNEMRLEKEQILPKHIVALLESTATTITTLAKSIKNYREKSSNVKSPTVSLVNYEMLAVTQRLLNMYPKMPVEEKLPPTEKRLPEQPPVASPSPALEIVVSNHQQDEESIPLPPSTNDRLQPLPVSKTKNDSTQTIQVSNTLAATISNQLLSVAETEEKSTVGAYQNIVNKLSVLQKKSIDLMNEPDKTPEREEKAVKTSELTLALYTLTHEFLELSAEERKTEIPEFIEKIQKEIAADSNSSFIDRHHNPVSKFMYTHVCSLGIFRTDTRKKLESLSEEYKLIGQKAGCG